MEQIIDLAQNISPLGVIAILALVVYQLVTKSFFSKKESGVSLDSIAQQLNTIAGNHLHELPAMRADITEIKKDVKEMGKEMGGLGNRVTRLEAKSK